MQLSQNALVELGAFQARTATQLEQCKRDSNNVVAIEYETDDETDDVSLVVTVNEFSGFGMLVEALDEVNSGDTLWSGSFLGAQLACAEQDLPTMIRATFDLATSQSDIEWTLSTPWRMK